MTRTPCPRLWQVEAARDGRLTGTDLSNAFRHRGECADCNQAARALRELGQQIKSLPGRPRDMLRQKRSRQALLGAWNEQLLAEPRPKARAHVALLVACCAVAGVALAAAYPLVRRASHSSEAAALRSKTQAGFEPKAKESWRPEPSSLPVAVPQATATERVLAKSATVSTPGKSRVAQPEHERTTAARSAENAEDDAYLRIVELLRSGHESEARAKASRYLVQFPNGFRRLEVEDIAER